MRRRLERLVTDSQTLQMAIHYAELIHYLFAAIFFAKTEAVIELAPSGCVPWGTH